MAAFGKACLLAHAQEAEVIVLHVIPPPAIAFSALGILCPQGMMHIPELPQQEQIRFDLEQLRPHNLNMRFRAIVETGAIAETILRCSRDYKADLIVLGRRARSRIFRWPWFSNSKLIVRGACCPIVQISQ